MLRCSCCEIHEKSCHVQNLSNSSRFVPALTSRQVCSQPSPPCLVVGSLHELQQSNTGSVLERWLRLVTTTKGA